ncbi:MAG: hypothetical protein OEV78_11875 [Spirochaetia bacterium]|nr:hypothetical protein [Spirochaetia bacterium]
MKNILLKLFLFSILLIIAGCDSIVKTDHPSKIIKKHENVFFESQDTGSANPEDDRTIYYKIFLDKELVAKTNSGLFFQKKKLNLHLDAGRYLFFAERWYLEESNENDVPEYKRANNVWQMKPIYIDIHDDPETFKIVFGINHDVKEFYYKIEGQDDLSPEVEKQ